MHPNTFPQKKKREREPYHITGNSERWGRQGGSSENEKGGDDGRRGEEGQNDDSMGPTAELIRISFSSLSGFEAGVGLMWV